jgi:hypothetical protein
MDTKPEQESSLTNFQVTDRLILRNKILQHFIRGVSEKQLLFKLYELLQKHKHPGPFFQPLAVGPSVLADSLKNQTNTALPILIQDKTHFYIIPFLTYYLEIISKETIRDRAMRYVGRACNLRRVVNPKVLESKETVNMFSFHYAECKNYVPVEILFFESGIENNKEVIESLLQWFFSIDIESPDLLKSEFDKRKSWTSVEKGLPFVLQLNALTLPLAIYKICPHLVLPYYLYSSSLPASNEYSISDPSKPERFNLYLFHESPEIPLDRWATLPEEFQSDEALYEAWIARDRKQPDVILAIVFTITYTLYILSVLNIYERNFSSASDGLPWVRKNIRAFKTRPYGYFTYAIPSHQEGVKVFPGLTKYIANYGFFWMIADLTVFDAHKENPTEGLSKTTATGKGILFYVLQSLIEQIQSWNRRKFRTTSTDIPVTLTTSFGGVEQELRFLGNDQKRMNDDDIINILRHLQTILNRPFAYTPLLYRQILSHSVFAHWDHRPGDLRMKQDEIGIQLATKLSEFERNCLLHNKLETGYSSVESYLYYQLDRFEWSPDVPLPLPPLVTLQSVWSVEHPISKEVYRDDMTRDLLHDAQKKARQLAQANKFWEVIRKMSHLYLLEKYGEEPPGHEIWMATIPRYAEEGLQCTEDCEEWSYLSVSHEESTKWYEFLERELLTRFWNISVERINPEARAIYEEISNSIRTEGADILIPLSERLKPYFQALGYQEKFFPLDLNIVRKELEEVIQQKSKESSIEQFVFPERLKQIHERFSEQDSSILTSESKTTSSGDLSTKPSDFSIETLEELYPILLQLLVLLPDGYRKQLISTTDEKTSLELKRELRQRVHKIKDKLDEISLKRLTEEYPIPPDRRQWNQILANRQETKRQATCGKTARENLTGPSIISETEIGTPMVSPPQNVNPAPPSTYLPPPSAFPETSSFERAPAQQQVGQASSFESSSIPSSSFEPRSLPTEPFRTEIPETSSSSFEPVHPVAPPSSPIPGEPSSLSSEVSTYPPTPESDLYLPAHHILPASAILAAPLEPSPISSFEPRAPLPSSAGRQELPSSSFQPSPLPQLETLAEERPKAVVSKAEDVLSPIDIELPPDFVNPFLEINGANH